MARQKIYAYVNVTKSTCDTTELYNLLHLMHAEERYNLLKTQYGSGYTILHVAAARGDTRTVRYVLEFVTQDQRYELLRIQDSSSDTAIHYSVYEDHEETIRCMLDHVTPIQQLQLLAIGEKLGKKRTALGAAQDSNNLASAAALQQYQHKAEVESRLGGKNLR